MELEPWTSPYGAEHLADEGRREAGLNFRRATGVALYLVLDLRHQRSRIKDEGLSCAARSVCSRSMSSAHARFPVTSK